MASNVKTIKAIYEATSAALTAPDEWYSFLRAVGQHFKYPYHDQLLIYAQRPDATACATVEKWNKHPQLRRWINRGAQGIAQLREHRGVTRLEYLFDISDTNSRIMPPPKLWELREEHHPLVAETLANSFGSDGESFISIEYHIIDAVQAIVDDNAQDYLAELLTVAEGSALADVDEDDLRALFQSLLLHSTIVAVMHQGSGQIVRDMLEWMNGKH